jgi:hypothetical protein
LSHCTWQIDQAVAADAALALAWNYAAERQYRKAETEMSKLIVDACVLIDSFQAANEHRGASIAFIEQCVRRDQLITMPAHGWFEVWCNVKRLSEHERKYLHPTFDGKMQLPLELIHIDDKFIHKYGNIVMPSMRASDHIYVVVAAVNGYPLVTRDAGMAKAGREIGVRVFTPSEFSESVASA